jgi:hypothetical protein
MIGGQREETDIVIAIGSEHHAARCLWSQC